MNGKSAGVHRGGYISFSFDITKLVTAGKNIITICAEDDLRSRNQPSGKQSLIYASHGCYYTRTTGIWQTVWLENTPCEYIESAKYYPNINDGTLTIVAKAICAEGKEISARAYFGGKEVGEDRAVVCGSTAVLKIKLSELHLWEIGKGGLYDLVISCGDDKVESYFGMRSVAVDTDGTMLINGKRVFQRLVLDQGFYPDGIYTAPTDEELLNDVKRSMACGFNGARLHEKIFEPRFLYHCDKSGYIVWEEHANWGLDLSAAEAYKAYFEEWRAAIERDFNHPAIIGWCPFNETQSNQDNDLITDIVTLTKTLDTTRPVIDCSGWTHVEGRTDIMDWHDYDQDPAALKERYERVANGEYITSKRNSFQIRPTFISEYGGIKWDINSSLDNAWGYGNAPTSEEEFLERFKGLAEALLFNKFINGICYTQLTDVEQETNGLYTYDRKSKFDPEIFKKILSQKAACEK